jgi:MoaA/NifB/PqqE/SkfB family radical SAM enzyme
MNKTIIKAPSITMDKMEALFIEMTEQNCNLRCKHCYINFRDKKEKDFIPIETIKQTLSANCNVDYIYLTGGEPMLHPDFNTILRLCLKNSNTVIHTNALNINDKKARFLRKVEEENQKGNEIILMISIDHYEEKINDEIRGRGAYRKAVHAIQSLIKYDFNPILCIVNHFNENKDTLKTRFKELCNSIGFETTDINFKIIPLIDKNKTSEEIQITDNNKLKIDCKRSRTLTKNGIFTCPLLCNDNRGKCGNNIENFSNKSYLETQMCSECCKNNTPMFSLDL